MRSSLPYDVIVTLPLTQQCKKQFDSLCLVEVIKQNRIRVYSPPLPSMTSYMNIFTFGKFCILQEFREYKNEVSSPSSSIVIGSERFYMAYGFRGFESHTSGSNLVKKVTRLFSSE